MDSPSALVTAEPPFCSNDARKCGKSCGLNPDTRKIFPGRRPAPRHPVYNKGKTSSHAFRTDHEPSATLPIRANANTYLDPQGDQRMKVLFYLPVVTPFWFENMVEPLIRRMASSAEVHILAPKFWRNTGIGENEVCLLYTSPSPRDATLSRMPSSA